jgi:hypothetical protein
MQASTAIADNTNEAVMLSEARSLVSAAHALASRLSGSPASPQPAVKHTASASPLLRGPNIESLGQSRRLAINALDPVNPGRCWAAMAPDHQGLDAFDIALCHHLHRPGSPVANPTAQPQMRSLLLGALAKIHTLNMAVNDGMNAFHCSTIASSAA